MNDTRNSSTPAWLEDAPAESLESFSTADEAKASIRTAIEADGADANSYDIDAIYAETYAYKIDTDAAGNELLNTARFEQIVSADEFWAVVARHAKES